MDQLDKPETKLRLRDSTRLFRRRQEFDVSGIEATLTTFDVTDLDHDPVPLLSLSEPVNLDLEIDPPHCGCDFEVRESHASIRPDRRDDERNLQVLLTGSLTPCARAKDSDSFHQLPQLVVEILDDTGFPLEENDYSVNIDPQHDRGTGIRGETATWAFTNSRPIRRFYSSPSQVVVRIKQDGSLEQDDSDSIEW